MASGKSDSIIRISTEAAQRFVDSYYPTLNTSRKYIADFYVPASALPDGKSLPIIIWNGNTIPDAASLQRVFEEQMPRSKYEVQGYDCHVLNPDYKSDSSAAADSSGPKKMSILVTISGYVRYGEQKTAEQRGFSETFVLVPNPSTAKERGRYVKEWLIQTQNFRLVV